MDKATYLKMRRQLYAILSVIGTDLESDPENVELAQAYKAGSRALDEIESICLKMGWSDSNSLKGLPR